MTIKMYKGTPYHLWNPYTPMETFLSFLGIGPTVITRGEGNYVFNDRGQRYLNANSCAWNFSIGYGREEIVDAAMRQMRELPFSSCFGKAHPRAIELAAKLVQITSGNFAHVYLASNGSEAVETALKIARQYHRQSPEPRDRGRFKIISLRGSYHGYAYGAVSLSGSADYEAKFGPLVPGFRAIEPPYCYRCPYLKEGYPGCGLACAAGLEQAILEEGPETVAAFVMEPVMGEFGVVAPPEEYYQVVSETCRRHGLLFITDEVTTGFGRTGRLFASQDWALQPDLLCVGKAISGGYMPLAATLATEAVFQRFLGKETYFMSGSTNSGNPVCAAVGLTAIDIILREKLPENAARVGGYLKSRLADLMAAHPMIGEVRGSGLMIAIDFTKDRKTREPYTSDEIFEIWFDVGARGVIVSFSDWGLSLFPPLTIDEGTADEIVHVMDEALHTGAKAQIDRKARQLKELAISKT